MPTREEIVDARKKQCGVNPDRADIEFLIGKLSGGAYPDKQDELSGFLVEPRSNGGPVVHPVLITNDLLIGETKFVLAGDPTGGDLMTYPMGSVDEGVYPELKQVGFSVKWPYDLGKLEYPFAEESNLEELCNGQLRANLYLDGELVFGGDGGSELRQRCLEIICDGIRLALE